MGCCGRWVGGGLEVGWRWVGGGLEVGCCGRWVGGGLLWKGGWRWGVVEGRLEVGCCGREVVVGVVKHINCMFLQCCLYVFVASISMCWVFLCTCEAREGRWKLYGEASGRVSQLIGWRMNVGRGMEKRRMLKKAFKR